MKNIVVNAVVRNPARCALMGPIRSWRQLGWYAGTLALGLPLIAALAHLFDPAAPLATILAPVLAGGLMPLAMLLPRRFDTPTRFQPQHLPGSLDTSLPQPQPISINATHDVTRAG